MADIEASIRRERYKKLRDAGYTRGWAQRARDFRECNYLAAFKVKP